MVAEKTDTNKKIKVSIIDDQKVYRDALKEQLSKDDRVILYKEYDSGLDFAKDLDQPFHPDVCLIDIVLNDISGVEVAKLVRRKHPNVHVILMTAYPSSSSFNEASQIGADYIEKGTRGEILLNKIVTSFESPLNEQIFSFHKFSEEVNHYLLLFAKELEAIQSRTADLSEFQRKVLKLRKAGKSIDEIAQLMDISPFTVRTHINRGLKKLNLPNFLKFINL
ncbi:MAG: response regulator transcription factor [Spirochaetota bacterium]|nr:response regulator transcription factor [Spirochaetota bacterium]